MLRGTQPTRPRPSVRTLRQTIRILTSHFPILIIPSIPDMTGSTQLPTQRSRPLVLHFRSRRHYSLHANLIDSVLLCQRARVSRQTVVPVVVTMVVTGFHRSLVDQATVHARGAADVLVDRSVAHAVPRVVHPRIHTALMTRMHQPDLPGRSTYNRMFLAVAWFLTRRHKPLQLL